MIIYVDIGKKSCKYIKVKTNKKMYEYLFTPNDDAMFARMPTVGLDTINGVDDFFPESLYAKLRKKIKANNDEFNIVAPILPLKDDPKTFQTQQ